MRLGGGSESGSKLKNYFKTEMSPRDKERRIELKNKLKRKYIDNPVRNTEISDSDSDDISPRNTESIKATKKSKGRDYQLNKESKCIFYHFLNKNE